MISPFCERAIHEAIQHGNAILKFISPNDARLTGTHQCGFYLPKSEWKMYTPQAPEKGCLHKHPVSIVWQDGRTTHSVVTWYGQKTRSEYRLTRFGRDFPWLNADCVGDLLILIPKTLNEWTAYVLDHEEDIEQIQSALGVESFEHWGVYQNGAPRVETEDECIERQIRLFSLPPDGFPSGEAFSEAARRILAECLERAPNLSPDDALMRYMQTEYQLFRHVERQVCAPEISGRLFKDIDDFLRTAASIMNRRKSRAGRSLENHIDYLLTRAGIPHVMRPQTIDGKPDIVIPSEDAYFDETWPERELFIVGIKTTCKDRWRQVLNEGRRIGSKHIITIQQGISTNQLREMHSAGVTLIAPQRIHKDYPKDSGITFLTLQEFMSAVKNRISPGT